MRSFFFLFIHQHTSRFDLFRFTQLISLLNLYALTIHLHISPSFLLIFIIALMKFLLREFFYRKAYKCYAYRKVALQRIRLIFFELPVERVYANRSDMKIPTITGYKDKTTVVSTSFVRLRRYSTAVTYCCALALRTKKKRNKTKKNERNEQKRNGIARHAGEDDIEAEN